MHLKQAIIFEDENNKYAQKPTGLELVPVTLSFDGQNLISFQTETYIVDRLSLFSVDKNFLFYNNYVISYFSCMQELY